MAHLLNMATTLAVRVSLLLITTTIGDNLQSQAHADPLTKYFKNVPIYNYHFAMNFKDHLGREARCTTWIVAAHQKFEQQMRDVCAFTLLGKRHCKHVIHSVPAFIFNGTEEELNVLLNVHHHMIEFVEPDSVVWAISNPNPLDDPPMNKTPELPGTLNPQSATWGLDRIDQRSGISGTYNPWLDGGRGTQAHVYVHDTGIMTTHQDFEGRAMPTLDIGTTGYPTACSSHDSNCAMDHHGHGSHCAGIISGRTYGVAKKVTVHAVKVLANSGSGYVSWGLIAMDWVATNAKMPAVVSMSLGSTGVQTVYKNGIDALVDRRITVVVAAGNSNSDACGYSPAFVPSAITVGATDSPVWNSESEKYLDCMAKYSNYGSCVDIWAPGSDITSVGISSNTGTATMSGTSMSCPHVSGAAALLMGDGKVQSPDLVKDYLASHASRNTMGYWVGYPKPNSPLYLLYVGWPGGEESLISLQSNTILHLILFVSISIMVLVGIVAGIKWQKSFVVRAIKTKPLLG